MYDQVFQSSDVQLSKGSQSLLAPPRRTLTTAPELGQVILTAENAEGQLFDCNNRLSAQVQDNSRFGNHQGMGV